MALLSVKLVTCISSIEQMHLVRKQCTGDMQAVSAQQQLLLNFQSGHCDEQCYILL